MPEGEKVYVVEDVIHQEQSCPNCKPFIGAVFQDQVSTYSQRNSSDNQTQSFPSALPEDQADCDEQWYNLEVYKPLDLKRGSCGVCCSEEEVKYVSQQVFFAERALHGYRVES